VPSGLLQTETEATGPRLGGRWLGRAGGAGDQLRGRVGALGGAEAAHQPHQLVEGRVDVEPELGRHLQVGRVEATRQRLALVARHQARRARQVHLVGQHDQRPVVAVLGLRDLGAGAAHLLERGAVAHRVDQREAVAAPHVLLAHRAELVLPCNNTLPTHPQSRKTLFSVFAVFSFISTY